jgi:hypothetical protein
MRYPLFKPARVVLVIKPPKKYSGLRGPVEIFEGETSLGLHEVDFARNSLINLSSLVQSGGSFKFAQYKLTDIEGLNIGNCHLLGLYPADVEELRKLKKL